MFQIFRCDVWFENKIPQLNNFIFKHITAIFIDE